MYIEDNTKVPRETISDELLLRMLDSTRPCCNIQQERHDTDGTCNKGRMTFGLEGYPLASMYAPLQKFKELYDKETALKKGTVFSELDLPFMGESVTNMGGGCCNDGRK